MLGEASKGTNKKHKTKGGAHQKHSGQRTGKTYPRKTITTRKHPSDSQPLTAEEARQLQLEWMKRYNSGNSNDRVDEQDEEDNEEASLYENVPSSNQPADKVVKECDKTSSVRRKRSSPANSLGRKRCNGNRRGPKRGTGGREMEHIR